MSDLFPNISNNISENISEILEEFQTLYNKHKKYYDDLEIIMGITKKKTLAGKELEDFYKKILDRKLNGEEITKLIEIAHESTSEKIKYFFLRIITSDINDLDNDEFLKKYNMENDLTNKEIKELEEQEKRLNELLY